jgi:dCMP deaminase
MNWDTYFIGFALWAAKRSTCARKKVGAIIVKDKRIISTGYNGVSRNSKHCEEYFVELYLNKYNKDFVTFEDYLKSEVFYNEHGDFSKKYELHAELNALTFVSFDNLSGCEMFVTLSPCINCSKLLVAHNFSRVVFLEKYDRDTLGLDLLNEKNIIVEQYMSKK